MAALEGCQQRLLSALQQGVAPPTPAPAPAPAARPASCSDARGSIGRPPGNRRHEELARIVGRLGCSTHQWQAEQAGLARRTSRALQAERQAGGSARHGSMPTSLDSLLREAVATPAWHAPSGQRSTVHAAVQQLLWVLRQLPPGGDAAGAPAGAAGAAEAALGAAPRLPQHRLSEEGWAAYWMLEPKVSLAGLRGHVLGDAGERCPLLPVPCLRRCQVHPSPSSAAPPLPLPFVLCCAGAAADTCRNTSSSHPAAAGAVAAAAAAAASGR